MRKVNSGQYDDSDDDDNDNKNNPWRGKIMYNNWLVPSRLSWERREARGVRGSPLSSLPSPLALLSFLKRDDWGRVRYNNVDSAGWLHKVKDITVLVVITKTSFTELDNKELHLCSGLSVTSQILTLSMASKRIGIPPSCLQKFLPFRSFLFKKWIHPQFWRNAISFGTFPPGKQDYLLKNSVAPGIFQLELLAKSCSIYFSSGYFQKLFGNG